MRNYSCLNKQIFSIDKYTILPIRDEDKYDIMQWRNEQIYHLRQAEPLTKEKQDWYYENVVSKLFEEKQPNQILFSYLENDVCIGYGGLVHINWIDKNAEISFVMNTKLEAKYFESHWINFVQLLEQVAFKDLNFHRIFTFAFDLRPRLYTALEKLEFQKEAILRDHYFWNDQYINAIIHSKLNHHITFRKAQEQDLELYFEWANDSDVRKNAINTNKILLPEHSNWFTKKISSFSSLLYYFEIDNEPLGQVRFDLSDNNKAIIDYSVSKKFRGKNYGYIILNKAIKALNEENEKWQNITLSAHVKTKNSASIKVFLKLNFQLISKEDISGETYFLFEK